jgi:hypothetical protein
MKLKLRRLRILAFGVLATMPFRLADGTVETIEQAKAEEKLFTQEMEMLREENKPDANDQPTVQKLRSLKVDDIRWRNTDVQAALADLKAKSKAVDPDHIGFDYVLRLPADMKQTDCLGRIVNNNICIILPGKTNVFDLLYYISEQTNLSFQVQKGRVTLKLWEPGAYMWLNLNR